MWIYPNILRSWSGMSSNCHRCPGRRGRCRFGRWRWWPSKGSGLRRLRLGRWRLRGTSRFCIWYRLQCWGKSRSLRRYKVHRLLRLWVNNSCLCIMCMYKRYWPWSDWLFCTLRRHIVDIQKLSGWVCTLGSIGRSCQRRLRFSCIFWCFRCMKYPPGNNAILMRLRYHYCIVWECFGLGSDLHQWCS